MVQYLRTPFGCICVCIFDVTLIVKNLIGDKWTQIPISKVVDMSSLQVSWIRMNLTVIAQGCSTHSHTYVKGISFPAVQFCKKESNISLSAIVRWFFQSPISPVKTFTKLLIFIMYITILWARLYVPVACIYTYLRNEYCLIIARGHHWENEMHRLKSEPLVNCADYLQPIKRLLISTENNSVLTKWVWRCIVHYIMQSAMIIYI